MRAFDFYFLRDGMLFPHPLREGASIPDEQCIAGGWSGGRGPAIPATQWPRSRVNGFPMIHLFTTAVPEEYRSRPDWVGLSVFQADDHVADSVPGVKEAFGEPSTQLSSDPFFAALQVYRTKPHPREHYLEDIIGGGFAVLWLNEAELNGDRSEPPPDTRTVQKKGFDGLNAWDDRVAEAEFRLVEREGDPNLGVQPVDLPDEDDEFVDVVSKPEHRAFFERVHGRCHFGGTPLPVQAMPAISPYFVEFEEIGGANFGGGNCQICLKTMTLDWACG